MTFSPLTSYSINPARLSSERCCETVVRLRGRNPDISPEIADSDSARYFNIASRAG